jgi:hypothetical protein
MHYSTALYLSHLTAALRSGGQLHCSQQPQVLCFVSGESHLGNIQETAPRRPCAATTESEHTCQEACLPCCALLCWLANIPCSTGVWILHEASLMHPGVSLVQHSRNAELLAVVPVVVQQACCHECSVHYISLLNGMGHQSATPFVISTLPWYASQMTAQIGSGLLLGGTVWRLRRIEFPNKGNWSDPETYILLFLVSESESPCSPAKQHRPCSYPVDFIHATHWPDVYSARCNHCYQHREKPNVHTSCPCSQGAARTTVQKTGSCPSWTFTACRSYTLPVS